MPRWRGLRALSPRIRTVNAIAILAAAVLAIIALGLDAQVFEANERSAQANAEYVACSNATYEMRTASDFLTSEARIFVMTNSQQSLEAYLEEYLITDRRGQAVEVLRSRSSDPATTAAIERAVQISEELADTELYAMRLAADGARLKKMPEKLEEIVLDEKDVALSAPEKRVLAESMLFNARYNEHKDGIIESAEACTRGLVSDLREKTEQSERQLRSLLDALHIIVLLLLFIIMLVIFATVFLVLWPMATFAQQIAREEALKPVGAKELIYLAHAYNAMREEVSKRTSRLEHEAERDPLTGLLNRGAYDELLAGGLEHAALLIVDVDHFKDFNDKYGHDIGDKVLKKVASMLSAAFRTSDYVCRIGGDEFAVVMMNMTPDLKAVVVSKVREISQGLKKTDDGLPPVTLSIGIAFSDDLEEGERIYPAADKALYIVKGRGRNGFAFYGEQRDDSE